MFTTIQNLIQLVKTGCRDSDKTFRGNLFRTLILQGVGQGNGAGPSILAIISSVL